MATSTAPSRCWTPPRPTSAAPTWPSCPIQRGILNYRLGRLDAAVADLTSAHELAALAGDRLTDLKALVNLGAIQSQRAEYDDARERLLEAITIAAELGQRLGRRRGARQPRVRRDERGQPARGTRRVRRRRGRLPASRGAGRAAAAARRPRAGPRRRQPARRRRAADRPRRRAVGGERQRPRGGRAAARVGGDRPRQGQARRSRGRAPTDAGRSFDRQGRDSWLHVAERLRLRAEARLDPDDPAVADGLVENAKALAAGGWRSEALASVAAGRAAARPLRAANSRPAHSSPSPGRRRRAAGRPTASCSPTSSPSSPSSRAAGLRRGGR